MELLFHCRFLTLQLCDGHPVPYASVIVKYKFVGFCSTGVTFSKKKVYAVLCSNCLWTTEGNVNIYRAKCLSLAHFFSTGSQRLLIKKFEVPTKRGIGKE